MLSRTHFYPRHLVEFTLSPRSPYATLDYGADVAGFPEFEVQELSGPVQIEVKYSEQFTGLLEPFSDGPSLFVSSLANAFRVETFNITGTGRYSSKLIQGGQRWQGIRLLTNGTVKIGPVSFRSSVGVVDTEALPSRFHSSNPLYNKIWKLGARAVSLACYDPGSQKSIWEVSRNGARVESSLPSYSVKTWNFTEYDLEFEVKIARGGAMWSIGYDFGIRSQGGVLFNLASSYPAESTYINTNRTLFPPSTISLARGVSFVNQTTLSSYLLGSIPVPFDVQEGLWYRVSTVVRSGHLAVSLNNTQVFNVSLSDYSAGGSPISTTGAFGFGAWQDQSAYIRSVQARSPTGQIIYQNPMTNATVVLPEYGVHDNYFATCVDGARRDRLVWLGDFVHTSRIVGVTTGRNDHVKGTFQQLLTYQMPTGQLPMAPSLGFSPDADPKSFAVRGIAHLLPDYHILALISMTSYMEYSDDVAFARQTWDQWRSAVNWLASYRSNETGLIDLSSFGSAFLGPTSGSAVNTASVEAFTGMATVAKAVGDTESAAKWSSLAGSLRAAVNAVLWNGERGIYSLEASDPGNFSVAALGFAITSGTANLTQAQSALSHLPALKLGPGYRDSSAVASSDSTANLSPNTNGFLLSALLLQKQTAASTFLFQNLWGAMLANESSNSGASWEYVSQQSEPGYGQYTSLSHPWGGAATYALTKYVAGIQPDSFGYKTWIIEPAYAGMGVDAVNASVMTPSGPLSVSWSTCDSVVTVDIDAPPGTSGKLVLSRGWISGGPVAGHEGDFVQQIEGGQPVHITHHI
ncbi:Six-hairpin glycosidase-like protein [Aspergillus tamarii]|uniref:Six-hairpin glycosidase-like protein n=1 Tax=Aspergillus tamarii TaxID=41984 RepID=A0A5N6UGA8_ASPTM|nr:Six-hairpin glycosidase-like protein [Aspergillus tamarii]